MTLVICSECSKEVSDRAENCPSCGNPIHHNVDIGKPFEIELTSKKWKKKRLWAFFLFCIGFYLLYTKFAALGIILIVVSVIMGFIVNIGSWWTNG